MYNEEMNKIIAEYMNEWVERYEPGHKEYEKLPIEYHKSLDALVPVWEKLKVESFRIGTNMAVTCRLSILDLSTGVYREFQDYSHKSIQHAAALATAKAILEIENG